MPLISVPAKEAMETRKANRVAYYGPRLVANRTKSLIGPESRPTVQFDSVERIFTIGSCFAREVEDGLLKRGFQIPVRAFLDKEPEFATVGTEALNNYGTPSIFNELSWALGPDEQYIAKDHLLELRPGKFVD